MSGKPQVSVIVEGYNESLSLGSAASTLDALKGQDFPLDQVEVVLVGSPAQVKAWDEECSGDTPFASVKTLALRGAHYYALKNEGARVATADIIALTDSDARPEPGWLSAIVRGVTTGADVTGGMTLFQDEQGRGPDHPVMQVAAAISWGFIVSRVIDEATAAPAGFLSHNVGFRAEAFRRHLYRTDLGRTCAGSLLYKALVDSGATITLQPDQRVVHNFSFRWWVFRLHRRFGYEVFLLRRLDASSSWRWLTSLTVVEPVLTMLWHMLLDIPQWLRFSRLLRVSHSRRLLLLPVVVGLSALARGSEMVGMYKTIAAPRLMKDFAESS